MNPLRAAFAVIPAKAGTQRLGAGDWLDEQKALGPGLRRDDGVQGATRFVGWALAHRMRTSRAAGRGPPYAAFFLPSNRPNSAMPMAPPTTAQSAMLNAGQ